MLCRAVSYLLQREEPLFAAWFTSVVKEWAGVGLNNGKLVFTHPRRGHVELDDAGIIKLLYSHGGYVEFSTPAMWQLCRFFDTASETDAALVELVRDTTGVSLELSAFTSEKHGLFTACALDCCSGDYQSAEKFEFQVDSGRLFVILPHSSDTLRDFLVGRLRRIAA